jgi:hypothetical protein
MTIHHTDIIAASCRPGCWEEEREPNMDLDALLAEVLTPLGVVLEDEGDTMSQPVDADPGGEPTCTMFQTSREHYGVFYRLDLIDGQPELRVIMPSDLPPARMRMFRVRPAPSSDMSGWFARLHETDMVGDTHAACNHMLFACGEILKNLFWAGNADTLHFPDGVVVTPITM